MSVRELLVAKSLSQARKCVPNSHRVILSLPGRFTALRSLVLFGLIRGGALLSPTPQAPLKALVFLFQLVNLCAHSPQEGLSFCAILDFIGLELYLSSHFKENSILELYSFKIGNYADFRGGDPIVIVK